MSVLVGLPEASFAIAPELRLLEGLQEPRSTCSSCPIAVPPEQLDANPRSYRDDARCCTYHPELLCWQVGRALQDPGSAGLVRARLETGECTSAAGIERPNTWVNADLFGRRLRDRCPYWAGGELACGIWCHRTGVCRVWFCRVEDGDRSLRFWGEASRLIRLTAEALAIHCLEAGAPPAEGASPAALAEWFVRCAERVAALSPEQAAALRDDDIAATAERMEAALASLGGPVPDIVTASIREVAPLPGGRLRIVGYRHEDPVEVPGQIFLFIGRLDGQTRWQDAVAAARADGLALSDAGVELLYRRGVIDVPSVPGAQVVINNQPVLTDP